MRTAQRSKPCSARRPAAVLCLAWLRLAALAIVWGGATHGGDPEVSNVRAGQRPGTKLIDVTYDLTDADSPYLTVSIAVSSDGGATWAVPCTHATGDIGPRRTPGTGKTIVWDMGADWSDQWSEHMRVQVTADDALGPPPDEEFALIPGGTNSGANPLAEGESYDPPWYPATYSLTVSPYYLGRTEVTKATWDTVRDWGLANGYTDLPAGGGKDQNHPVHSVNWYDVVKWCNARSEMEARTPCYTVAGSVCRTGQPSSLACDASASGYRLPTDTEWEYAARGGLVGKRFPWGDTISHSEANYYSSPSDPYDVSPTRGHHPAYDDPPYPYTSPVASFACNAYGLYDLAGNSWEWCWDWLPGYEGTLRTGRGGSWSYLASDCRTGSRDGHYPGSRDYDFGFRACVTAPGQ
jgi:formylglycine-generating enzyme required for sulfatase activity